MATEQLSLFNDSSDDLKRVKEKIAAVILRHYRPGLHFHMAYLTKAVMSKCAFPVAPDSPGRIMRMMKKQGLLNYTLISRPGSLYRWEKVENVTGI